MASTVSTISPWLVPAAVTAREARYASTALLGKAPASNVAADSGVLPGFDDPFALTSNGTSGAPRVAVKPGLCVVETSAGGTYICSWPTSQNLSFSAPSGNPRIDLVCARVQDNESDAGGSTQFSLITVDGVAAASPSAPATPAGYFKLFEVRVNTNGSLVVTDRRLYTAAAGGVRFCPAHDVARAGSHEGQLRVRENGTLDVYEGGAWVVLASPAVWTSFTPTLFYSGTNDQGNTAPGTVNLGSGGTAVGRYLQVGKLLHLRYDFRMGSPGSGANGGSGTIYTQLPPGFTSAPVGESHIYCKLNTFTAYGGTNHGIFGGDAFVPANGNVIRPYFPRSRSDVSLYDYIITTQAGEVGLGNPLIAGGAPNPQILTIQGVIEIA